MQRLAKSQKCDTTEPRFYTNKLTFLPAIITISEVDYHVNLPPATEPNKETTLEIDYQGITRLQNHTNYELLPSKECYNCQLETETTRMEI
ncbi:12539_t:CDS:2 [Gigaspora margarita]|uniref:12539_t:CDS:1 n=1 Tax=Gigaspora margarita TaxID=4874 RepID=A0ABN7UJM7_GIGMA|nr:12539_t:CDS:2 [Gigaspora margarita]